MAAAMWCDKLHSKWFCTAVNFWNEDCFNQFMCELADYDQGIVYITEYQLHCTENTVDSIGIMQSLYQVYHTYAHTRMEPQGG